MINKKRINLYIKMLKEINNKCVLALFNNKSTIAIRSKDKDMEIGLNAREIKSLFKRGDRIRKVILVVNGGIEDKFNTDIKTPEELDNIIISFLNNKISQKLVHEI